LSGQGDRASPLHFVYEELAIPESLLAVNPGRYFVPEESAADWVSRFDYFPHVGSKTTEIVEILISLL
jgi:hypothetical protein